MTLDHDLQARPIYHHQRDSIDAHPTIVFTAPPPAAGSKTALADRSDDSSAPPRRHRTIPADPLPDDLRTAVAAITQGTHQLEPSRGDLAG
jgi:hypothetical protein